MAGEIRFGFARDKRGERLTITAPSEALNIAKQQNVQDYPLVRNGSFGSRRIYGLQGTTEDTATWYLNAKAIGRIRHGRVRDAALDITSGFIQRLTAITHRQELATPDPLLDLTYYSSPYGDEIEFISRVARPQTPSEQIAQLMREHMATMAQDLRYDHYSPLRALRVNLDGDGVQANLSAYSSIHTMSETWQPGAEQFDLNGNNVMAGAEPLVYLAGAVALAHADELVNQ